MDTPLLADGANPLSPVAILAKIIFPVADGIIAVPGVVDVVDVPVALSNTDIPPPATALAAYAHKVNPPLLGMEIKFVPVGGLITYHDSHRVSVTP